MFQANTSINSRHQGSANELCTLQGEGHWPCGHCVSSVLTRAQHSCTLWCSLNTKCSATNHYSSTMASLKTQFKSLQMKFKQWEDLFAVWEACGMSLATNPPLRFLPMYVVSLFPVVQPRLIPPSTAIILPWYTLALLFSSHDTFLSWCHLVLKPSCPIL